MALAESASGGADRRRRIADPDWWLEFGKVFALPLATLVLGALFNRSLNARQARESDQRLYAEMMGRREQADSDLRKDMFKSILETFMSKSPKLPKARQMEQEVLNLELLAYNFHESLDIGPLFKDVRSQIPDQPEGRYSVLRTRLEKVAQEVIQRQLTVLSDTGMVELGDTLPEKIESLQAYLYFGTHAVPDDNVKPGQGVSRVCLSMASPDGGRHFRQFKLEVIGHDPVAREVQFRLYASRSLDEGSCRRADVDLDAVKEIDTNFSVGLFDFPMIDNTRLSHGERCAVSLTALTPNVLNVALAYFPGSRASLKDKPYYDEVMHDLLSRQGREGAELH